jgi:Flp pilus assembly protein TadD
MRNVDALVDQALDLHRRGELARAAALYRQALAKQPRNAQVHHLLGCLLVHAGDPRSAIASLARAAAIDPDFADVHIVLGNTYLSLEEWRKAEPPLRRALELEPDFVGALNNLSVALQRQGKNEEAESLCRRAIELEPGHAEIYSNLAYALYKQRRFDEAETQARMAIDLDPQHAMACNNLALILIETERYDEAEIWCRRAIEIQPGLVQAHEGLSNLLRATHNYGISEEAARQAVALRPDLASTHDALGAVLLELDRFDEAEESFRTALRLDAAQPAVLTHLASALRARGKLGEAIEVGRRSVEVDPNPTSEFHLGCDLLATGQFDEGWRRYERRDIRLPQRRFDRPVWSGDPLPGRTLLIHAEQGLGDTLQFARFLPDLKRRAGARILFECQYALAPLLSDLEGIDAVQERAVDLSPPAAEYDAQFSLLSAPLLLGTRPATIPAPALRLNIPAEARERWRKRLEAAGKLKVGLRWCGNPAFERNGLRSAALAGLAPLASVPGVRFFSLQTDAAARQAEDPPAGMELVDLSAELSSFQETAAVLANLDLMITTDTSVAHLAGVMKVPTWLLLSAAPDWRWMQSRDDSPWYPEMRLFRQRKLKDWSDVAQRAADALRGLVGESERDGWQTHQRD